MTVTDLEAIRSDLLSRLRSHSSELEEALIARALEISPQTGEDREGLTGIKMVASEAVDFIATAIEQGEDWRPILPSAIAAQVRYLARNEVALDSVMEGYTAAIGVFMEFLTMELDRLPADAVHYLLRMQTQHSDRIMRAYSVEYMREVEHLNRSSAQRLEQQVRKLLAGSPMEAASLDYDFDSWHLGIVATDSKADMALQRLAEKLGCRLLFVPRNEGETCWAWLGTNRRVSFSELEPLVPKVPTSVSLTVGEPRRGMAGWRLTHQEAQLARGAMPPNAPSLIRGSNVVLAAAIARDDMIQRCLIDAYLGPLNERKEGPVLLDTLRSYFALDCNAASTAASLGVDRHTVRRRLQRIETYVGRPLSTCRVELEVALRVELLAASDKSLSNPAS